MEQEMRLIEEDNCPGSLEDYDDCFGEYFEDIVPHARNGTLSDEMIGDLTYHWIERNECGATLRVKMWIGDATTLKGKLTRKKAYDICEWSFDILLLYYFEPDVGMNWEDEQFGYELWQWGQYVILASGFSA